MAGPGTTFLGLSHHQATHPHRVAEALLTHPSPDAADLAILGMAVEQALPPEQSALFQAQVDNLLNGDTESARRELAHLLQSTHPHHEAELAHHLQRRITPPGVQIRMFDDSGRVMAALRRRLPTDPASLKHEQLGAILVRGVFHFKPHYLTDLLSRDWRQLAPIAQAADRLTFAKRVKAFLETRYAQIYDELLSGKRHADQTYGQRLSLLVKGLRLLIDAIDAYHQKNTEGWILSEEAGAVLHDDVFNPLQRLDFAAQHMMGYGGINLLTANNLSRARPHRKVTSVAAAVHSALFQNAFGLAGKEIHVTVDVPETLHLKNPADRDGLIHNLTELINNAVKYADPHKPEKHIRIRWDAVRQALAVSDNGIGIKETAAVWKNGVREAHGAAEGNGEGLGLVKSRSEEMGWKIAVESKAGVGTTFFLIPPAGGLLIAAR